MGHGSCDKNTALDYVVLPELQKECEEPAMEYIKTGDIKFEDGQMAIILCDEVTEI
jgi:hypothetical protein